MSDDVVVISEDTFIVVGSPDEAVVVSGETGPQGATGPQGPPGATTTYVHTQAVASTTWTIPHNRGHYPSGIFAKDTADDEVYGSRTDPSVNTTVLTFSAAIAGTALVN